MPRAVLEETALDGDFAKRHLIDPVLLRILGDLTGLRVLDAGCGNGYLSRMLTSRGAQVTGVEPGLTPGTAAGGPEGISACVSLPNFLIVAARRAA